MVTIFTNPRPFRDQFDLIQRNAIQSWLKLSSKCEIILFNDEENTTPQIAQEFNLQCITDVECDEFGTPLLNDVFRKIKKIAKNDIFVYVNTDIILMSDFLKAIREVKELMGRKLFFMVGRRWDMEVKEQINFNEIDWEQKLRNRVLKEGKIHGMSGLDYWVFPRDLNFNPPPFVIGRPGMDSWLIYKSRILKIPVIDATEVVTAIHQNHSYPLKKRSFFEIEKQRNFKLAGGFAHLMSLRDADWILTPKGLERPRFPRIIFSKLSLFYPWRLILATKRRINYSIEKLLLK